MYFSSIKIINMRKLIKKIYEGLGNTGVDIQDLLFITGTGLIGYGLYQIFEPLAFIANGVILLFIAFPRFPKGK